MEFIIATNNNGKVSEFKQILERQGHTAKSLKDINLNIEVVEDGQTFKENAYKKAYEVSLITKKPTIADDSGLMVSALNGDPGVRSARYGSSDLDDKGRTKLLLKNMESMLNRDAKFVSAICAVFPDGKIVYGYGECEGTITFEEKGNNGFGYDPIFYVEDYKKTFAQMSNTEKNEISHRAKALNDFANNLKL